MVEWKQVLSDTMEMTFIAAYQETFVNSEQDYNGTTNPSPTLAPAAFVGVFPGAASFYGLLAAWLRLERRILRVMAMKSAA